MQEEKNELPKLERKVTELIPGMEVARDVYSDDNKVLVNAGTIISKQTIEKLENWQVSSIFIVPEILDNPLTDPKLQQFINTYNKSVTVVQKAFDTIRETHEVPIETFAATADSISENVSSAGNIIDQLYNLPKCDDYTFHHSVNVSAIAALIAIWLKYPPESISAVSLAALLHDIGKSLLPPELLNKPYKLPAADYKKYQEHTKYGYDLVSKIPTIAQSVLSGILDHHEREDGSGYPQGLNAQSIHPYAKIIAVADLYDEALTINCEQPGKLSPYYSLERLRDNLCHLDAKACITFMQNMTNYLSGNQVTLSDGRQGRVVFVNKDRPCRSMVQLANGKVLNLIEDQDLQIHSVVR